MYASAGVQHNARAFANAKWLALARTWPGQAVNLLPAAIPTGQVASCETQPRQSD